MNEPTADASVLIVDDDSVVSELVAGALRLVGYAVSIEDNGLDGLRSVRAERPDLVILDVEMPEMDGIEVCRRLRRDGFDMPVMFLTSHGDLDHLRAGFDEGADDYLTKPFSIEEVALRVRALLRRTQSTGRSAVLAAGDLIIDEEAHQVRRAGEAVDLTPTEFRLLRFLVLNKGRVMSREQIVNHVWEYDYDGNDAVVETYISYVRKKLGETGSIIETVRGVGYVVR